MECSFDSSLKLTKRALLCSGIDLDDSKPQVWKTFLNFLFYSNLVWLYTDVLGELFWLIEGILENKSFGELSLIVPCTTICFLSTVKSAPMYFYKETIANVVNKLRSMHPKFDDNAHLNANNDKTDAQVDVNEEDITNDESERTEKDIVKEAVNMINALNMLFYYTFVLVVFVFTTLPMIVMVYEYYTEGKIELKLPFLVKYFFDPFTKIRWPLVYIHQVWSASIVALNVFGVDSFLSSFCSYARMHFLILCHRFENVVLSSNAVTKERLTVLVKRHQVLIELVNQVEMVFSKGILFNMVTSSVLICLSGFNVTFLDDGGAVFAFFTFLVMNLAQISMLCLFGDLLVRSSTKVGEAIFKCRWYDTDRDTKKFVFLVLIRSQKPCKLTAAKFADLNLTAFTTILSRSWSYFALLRTVYK